MKVRRVTKSDDFRAIADIYVHSWQAAYRGIVPDDYLDGLRTDRWAGRLEVSAYTAMVLTDGERYIGTCSFAPARDGAMQGWGEIISFYLLPEYFGSGCAGILMREALESLDAAGYPGVYLWVLEENTRARKFYEKYGFALNGDRLEIEIGGRALMEVRYIRGSKAAAL